MKQPRYTDLARYRLPYVRAAMSRAPGYLARRFEKFCPGWRAAKQK